MRVLVTGAGGFVGRAVVHRLVEAGHDVAAVTRGAGSQHAADVRSLTADVLDPAAIEHAIDEWEPDGVCHLAALTRVRDSFQQPTRYFAVNVTGTLHVLQALAQLAERTARVPRLVFGSTAAVYGLAREQPIAEDAPSLPTTPYGATKLAADHAIGFQAATGALAAVSLRCFNVAGATPQTRDGDLTRVVPKALAVAAGSEPYLVMNGDGSSIRDYLHVADLADAYAAALDAAGPAGHTIYNVGSGLPVSLRDVVDSVERVTGRRLPIRRSAPQNEPPALLADSTRIRQELAWEPRRSEFDTIVGDAWEAVGRARG
jgi:UDP-glucose 4-epimerase